MTDAGDDRPITFTHIDEATRARLDGWRLDEVLDFEPLEVPKLRDGDKVQVWKDGKLISEFVHREPTAEGDAPGR